ncbi:phosphotransferase [Kribbella antibiotica]|uniref:phosphotransferase n=1 Tax=Kribbella antibiotica TaxID=190195 RepID=UPI001405553A|nr:phosphotransferase [Kribbella antibiotica]
MTNKRRTAVLDGLQAACGQRPTVVAEHQVGHEWAPVTRLVFDRDLPGVGRTAIVKTRRVDGEGHGGPAYLRREVAGLRAAAPSGTAAQLILYDDRSGVVVQSDLGVWPTLEKVLHGDDRGQAVAAMHSFAQTVGRLHASTINRRTDHAQALAEFGGADVTTGADTGTRGTRRWHLVEAACQDLGFPDAGKARDDIAFVRAQLEAPGRYAAVVHNDLNPTNALVTDDGVRLVDFEGSGFGHIGFDASFLHFPFPHHSANWSVLPQSVTQAADAAYRAELGTAMLSGYDEMVAVGAAAAMAGRVVRLPVLARDDQSPDDSWRRRAQLVQQIGVLNRLIGRTRILSNLASWSHELAEAMTRRWPDATQPPPKLFTAFGSGS